MSEKPEHNPISDEAKYYIELSLIKAAYHVDRELRRHGHIRYYQNVRSSGVRPFSKLVKSIRELAATAYTPNEVHRAIHPFSLTAEIGLLTGSMIMRKALTPEQQARFIDTQNESLNALKLYLPDSAYDLEDVLANGGSQYAAFLRNEGYEDLVNLKSQSAAPIEVRRASLFTNGVGYMAAATTVFLTEGAIKAQQPYDYNAITEIKDFAAHLDNDEVNISTEDFA